MTSTDDPSTRQAIRVKQTHEAELLAKANVLGVGVGLSRLRGETGEVVAIVVLVKRKVPASELPSTDVIPSHLEGVPVEVREVGEAVAHAGEP